jgi:hypothetical protein
VRLSRLWLCVFLALATTATAQESVRRPSAAGSAAITSAGGQLLGPTQAGNPSGGQMGNGSFNAEALYQRGDPALTVAPADMPVDIEYTATGTIDPSLNTVSINAASATTQTLPAGYRDGHVVTIVDYGAGTATIPLSLFGSAQSPQITTGQVLRVKWYALHSTYIRISN